MIELIEDNSELWFDLHDHISDLVVDIKFEIWEILRWMLEDCEKNNKSALTELVNLRLAENQSHLEMTEHIFSEVLRIHFLESLNIKESLTTFVIW